VTAGRALAALSAAALAIVPVPPLPAQNKPDDEVRKQAAADPFTRGDAAAMAKAGIVAFGPLQWADHKTTDDIDHVLGGNRIIWLETAHLRLGCDLKATSLPADQSQKKAVLAELAAMHDALPAFPEKASRLEPWLRAHLFARRAEQAYAAFQQLVGITDATWKRTGDHPGEGQYLGQQDKFLLLLFQKKADLARYFERFCNLQREEPSRFQHPDTRQLVAVICCEGFETLDDPGLHRYAVYLLMQNFVDGYRGFFFEVPLWFEEGLAHWYSRRIESDFVTLRQKPGEALNREKMNLWPQKVRQRIEHQEMLIPFATVTGWSKWEDMGVQEHLQSWSRVDWLMSRGSTEVGRFIDELKKLPPMRGDQPLDKATINSKQDQLLQQLWHLDAGSFDEQWRAWVLDNYPKK
jgi:hypothetical protein